MNCLEANLETPEELGAEFGPWRMKVRGHAARNNVIAHVESELIGLHHHRDALAQVILDQLQERHVTGIYPPREDENCWFRGADFDKVSWQGRRQRLFIETCRAMDVPAADARDGCLDEYPASGLPVHELTLRCRAMRSYIADISISARTASRPALAHFSSVSPDGAPLTPTPPMIEPAAVIGRPPALITRPAILGTE